MFPLAFSMVFIVFCFFFLFWCCEFLVHFLGFSYFIKLKPCFHWLFSMVFIVFCFLFLFWCCELLVHFLVLFHLTQTLFSLTFFHGIYRVLFFLLALLLWTPITFSEFVFQVYPRFHFIFPMTTIFLWDILTVRDYFSFIACLHKFVTIEISDSKRGHIWN